MSLVLGLGLFTGNTFKSIVVLDNFDDGVTYMTLGLIDGVLSLWYTATDEVIKTWDNE